MSEDLLEKKPKNAKEMESADPNERNNAETENRQLPSSSESDASESVEVDVPSKSEDIETEDSREIKKIAQVIAQEFSGPIPPPNIIAGYEDVSPGSADRIIRMAEQQSVHRQQMELIQIKAESRDSLLGVIFAFMLGIGCIIACIIMVVKVPDAAGVICGSLLGVTGIGSIVTAFLKNTRRSDK